MDPLSVVSGAIAVTAFVGEIIKLAREIQRSIDKVPQNRKNLRRLTTDITNYVIELEKVYDARVLDESSDLHTALLDLTNHMREVNRRCCGLIVPRAKGRFNELRAAFKAWSNCNIIEAEIMELKDKVQAFLMHFMVFSLVRIEKPISGVASATSRIEQQLGVLGKQQQQGLSRMEVFAESLQASTLPDDNHFLTAITNTTTESLNLPSAVVETLYLHQQIETIIISLGTLAATQTFQSKDPSGPYLKPFKPAIPRRWAMNNRTPAAYHREVVAVTRDIIDVLQGPPGEMSVQNGAWDMVNLAIQLYDLGMYSDATTIGAWTVDLYRTLLDTNSQVYEPYLALALRNLSRYKTNIGDNGGAKEDIEECVMRERDMLKKPCKHSVHLELSNSLIEWWYILTRDGNFNQGLEVAQESFALLEGIRAELKEWEPLFSDTTDQSSSMETVVIETDEGDSVTSQSLNSKYCWDYISTMWLDFNTARAYHSLSYSLEDTGQIRDAYDRELQALAIYRGLCDQHPGIYDENLAQCLAHLSSAPLSNGILPSLSLDRMRESNQLYRALAASRPAKFTTPFIESLWSCATLLYDTGDFEAAEQCSTEALELIRRSNGDRLLLARALQESSWSLRHMEQNETAITIRREVIHIYRDLSTNTTAELDPMTVADRLYDLASDHIVVGQTDDAIAACREAVTCYRSIIPEHGSSAHLAGLARGLSYLTYALNVAQQYNQALSTGSEALALYRRLVAEDSNLIEPYLNLLRTVGFSACHADDTDAIKIHAEVVQAFRTLAVGYPDHVKWRLVDALHDHDYILTKHQRTHEACRNTEELVNHFRDISLEGSEVPSKFITALVTHAGSYTELGRVGETILLCKKAIAIGEKYSTDSNDPEISQCLADALLTYSECLRDTGKYDGALSASEASLDIYCRHTRDDTTILACKLREYALNLRHVKRLPEAIAAAEEAVGLCRSSPLTTLFVKTRLPYVLETLAMVFAEAGDGERAFEAILEATVLFRELKSNPTIAEPWSYAETLYADALVNISAHYTARGNWDDAEATISEATEIYKRRVISASAYHPPLAKALDMATVQRCVAGRHEEAKLTAKDLHDRKCHLDLVDPEVAMLVRVALAELAGRSFQSALRHKHLGCAHCFSADVTGIQV